MASEDPTKAAGAKDAEPPATAPHDNNAAAEAAAAADPDEDDLDDLDDMLDDFSAVKINQSKPAVPLASAAAAAAATPVPDVDPLTGASSSLPGDDDFSEEEFQKQLQAGMAELMGDLENNVQPEMQAQFENIFKGLSGDTGGATSSAAAGPSKVPSSADAVAAELSQDATFQETIKRTMERMQASGDQATAAAAAEGSEDDFIAEMMKAMKDMPGADGSEEDFSKLLMGMMEQLTNKEILYEPMKELNDKFPAWMEKNKATLSKEDLTRFTEQQTLVKEIVGKFEEKSYSDSNVADREYIVDRMQKMQAAGSPPHDLVGDMPSAKEVLDAPDESCAQQ
ncbi:Pex19 protein family-domain-containing protein [Xylariaceae sp. FL0255]|nr:Pex19 protein family-domain-containing protein [Xylariaceae sp. FL0255]